MIRLPDDSLRVLVQGGQRVRVQRWVQTEPYLVAEVAPAPDVVSESVELLALMRNVQQTFTTIVGQVPYLPEELQVMVANVDDPIVLSHVIAGALRLKTDEKQELLEELDVAKRLRRLSGILARELEVVALGTKIQSQVQSEFDRGQREYFLRQQMKAIQEELGEADEVTAEVNALRDQLAAIELPEEPRKQVDRELERLERLQPAMAEYGVVRNYLEWIASLPWDKTTEDNLDLRHARRVLDADHYDIEQVKERILEFLAVRSLKPDARGSILLFVGPPGVGKTSLGRSMARALGRQFERISVGGVRDEAEIRGHRRTYIGAMPGVIIRALRDAGAKNPLLMIDEIDKLGADFRGDPASAMLEVLDPEQNESFRDHYLDLPFALSDVMFVTHGEHAGHDPGAAARPHGSDPARRVHRIGEARDRQALPGPKPDRAKRPDAIEDRVHRPCPARDHLRLHARGWRATARAGDRSRGPQGRAARGRGDAEAQAHGHRAARPRAARQAAVLSPRRAAGPRARASRRVWRGRRSAARCCSSRRARCRAAGT